MVNKTTKETKKFEVGMWWYELHGGQVTVEAESKEEAERLVKENFEEFKSFLKKKQDTYSNTGDEGVDEAVENVTKESTKDDVYCDRFNTDVYVEGTTGSYWKGNILELGRVVYTDYCDDELPYMFDIPREYGSEYNYYSLGACHSRIREEVLFNTGDFRQLLFRNLKQGSAKNKYDFANSIDSALSGNKHILMLQLSNGQNQYIPRTIRIRAIKVEKYSYNIPYRLHLMDYSYLPFTSTESFVDTITMNKKIKGTNGEEFFIFLNTPEHLNLLERIVEELIIDKPNKY